MIKINIEHVNQINQKGKEEFLSLNNKPLASKTVNLEFQLGGANSKCPKFMIHLYANIMDINYHPGGYERSMDKLF